MLPKINLLAGFKSLLKITVPCSPTQILFNLSEDFLENTTICLNNFSHSHLPGNPKKAVFGRKGGEMRDFI